MTDKAEPGWVDQALKKDIDWETMKKKYIDAANERYDAFEEKLKEDPEMKNFNPYWEFGIKNANPKEFKRDEEYEFIPETREQHLEAATPATFAVLKDGEWFEKGKMGWWACVSDEKDQNVWNKEFSKLIEEAPDDTLFTLVDCHI